MSFRDVRSLFLELNVWLCFTSLFMVAISSIALSVPLAAVGLGFLLPALLFYFIYVEDRRDVDAEDWTNHPHRTRLVQRYRSELLLTEAMALVGYEALLLFLIQSHETGLMVFALGQLPLGVLAVYGNIKRRPAMDSLAVGGTWAFVIVFTVLVAPGGGFSTDAAVVFLAWFSITFAGVESRNIRDIEGDRAAEKTTLAGHLGERATRVMVSTLKAGGVAIFWYTAGVLVAGLAVVHLLLLYLFRSLTKDTDTMATGDRYTTTPTGGTSSRRPDPVERR